MSYSKCMNIPGESAPASIPPRLGELTEQWFEASIANRYSYNFTWLGRPVIQYPQDLVMLQEIIWENQPELIIETGIAHGGSLIFSASMLELNAACGGPSDARVLGIDIDIRQHNRIAIEQHAMFHRISMIEGSSIDPIVVEQVKSVANGKGSVLVILDSSHTYAHVRDELEAYAYLATIGNYCVVFDTVIEDLPAHFNPDRPWGPGNSPKTAVREFLSQNPDFVSEESIDLKLLISAAPEGYLRRIS